jgi:hypothetical protein
MPKEFADVKESKLKDKMNNKLRDLPIKKDRFALSDSSTMTRALCGQKQQHIG